MAINFPNDPANGETFTDSGTLTSWQYDSAKNAWTSVGAGASSIHYRGGINFTVSYEDNDIEPIAGDIYSNTTAGTAHSDFTGIAGEPVSEGALFLYDGTQWNSLEFTAGPFERNAGTGVITPVNAGDDLDMLSDGSYLIESLSELD